MKRICSLLLAASLSIGSADLGHAFVAQAQGNITVPGNIPTTIFQEEEVYAILNPTDSAGSHEIEIKTQPQSDADKLLSLPSGYQIKLLGFEIAEETIWYQIETAKDDQVFQGYVRNENVVSANQHFNEWKVQYEIDSILAVPDKKNIAATGSSTNLNAFPGSYRSYIQKLISTHPNWTFVPMNTGLDWNTVIENEMAPTRNLVPTYTMTTWKSTEEPYYDPKTGEWTEYSGGGWVQASESIVKYQMDPRNFLNEDTIFQFELLTFNSSFHNVNGVEAILKNTFMSKKVLEDKSGGGITYGKAFMKIAESLGVSPYFLAGRVRQEQGSSGNSELISGKYPSFEGYYNYFNIGATGLTHEQVVINGLREAVEGKWNTRFRALQGGAKKAANNYIKRGQDTLYLQKFDVDGSYDGRYYHQYMQNLLAAENEGKNVRNAYSDMNVLGNSFVFKIPVYENMPATASARPKDKLSKPSLSYSLTGLSKINLRWSEVSGASGYYISRSTNKDSGYKRVKEINSVGTVTWSDNALPGQTYYYRVCAYKTVYGGAIISPYSDVLQAKMSLAKPVWQSAGAQSYSKAGLVWKKVSGVDGYQVLRRTGKNDKLTVIATIPSDATVKYTDAKIEPNKSYDYAIRAYVKMDNKTYLSGRSALKNVTTTMERPVLEKVSYGGTKSLGLQWKAVKWVSGYQIFRRTSVKAKSVLLTEVSGANIKKFVDKTLSKNKTYYYKIRSYVIVGGKKRVSPLSTSITGKTALARPTLKSVKRISKSQAKLSWAKTVSADGYQIYRSVSNTRSFQLLRTTYNYKSLSITNKKLVTGKTYYYKIRAYSNVGGVRKYSRFSTIKKIG